jgi:hypothetical protein
MSMGSEVQSLTLFIYFIAIVLLVGASAVSIYFLTKPRTKIIVTNRPERLLPCPLTPDIDEPYTSVEQCNQQPK